MPQEGLNVRQSRLVWLDEAYGKEMPYGMKAKSFDLRLFAKVFQHIPYGLLVSWVMPVSIGIDEDRGVFQF